MKVTKDEHVHDNKALPELIENTTISNNKTIDKLLLDDSAYDSNYVFRCLADKGIYPYISKKECES